MAVLNLPLVPERGLKTHQGSHILKPPSLPTNSNSSWDAGSHAGIGMLGLEEVNAVLAEHSNLLLFVPLSLPEELRWGRIAGSHLELKAGHIWGCLRSACLSAGHLEQSLITLAVNYFFPFHLVGAFPAVAWDCCFPSPRWTQPCHEVGHISLNAVHTRRGKGTCPPLPLATYPEWIPPFRRDAQGFGAR